MFSAPTQVKAFEITTPQSPSFRPSEYSVRFPRCLQIRDNKSWSDVQTYAELVDFIKACDGKIAASKRRAEDIANDAGDDKGGGKRPRRATKRPAAASVPAHLRVGGVVEAESDALAGVVAAVKGQDTASVDALRVLVQQLGGEVRVNTTTGVTHLIDADATMGQQIESEVKFATGTAQMAAKLSKGAAEPGSYDIVRGSWVQECSERGERVAIAPRHVHYATEATRVLMGRMMDAWGDRYVDAADAHGLRTSMGLAAKVDGSPATRRRELAERLRDMSDDAADAALATSRAILRHAHVYAHADLSPAARLRLRLLGATVVAEPNALTSHAVLPDSARGAADAVRDTMRTARLSSVAEASSPSTWVVGDGWIRACEEASQRATSLLPLAPPSEQPHML